MDNTLKKLEFNKQQAQMVSINTVFSILIAITSDNYYRLKMIDDDGRFTYSKVIRINASLRQSPITFSPNPVINTATLTIQSNKNETIQFFLHDVNGKLVSIKSFNLVKGSNLLRWDLQTIPAGNYFISSGSDQLSTIKIIKQ